MNDSARVKSLGGIAPFGYRWSEGVLVVDKREAPIRKLIFELFVKHRRKKTVAKLLNDLGYRTRNEALFSDTTIGRLLRDTTAKGMREVDGNLLEVEPIITPELWERANTILGSARSVKQAVHLFTGIVYCVCGGKMIVPSNSAKYVCVNCRRKIQKDDLEDIFHSQLKSICYSDQDSLYAQWLSLGEKDKRTVVEHTCERIVIESDAICIEFLCPPSKEKSISDQIDPGKEPSMDDMPKEQFNEPLLSESEAAKFLGISKMTVLRKRNAGEILFFRIGFRILYSKEKHLIPFLRQRESGK